MWILVTLAAIVLTFWAIAKTGNHPSKHFSSVCGLKPVGRGFGSSVAGTSFPNDNGSSRTEIIVAKCKKGDALALVRESDNRFDSNAVALYRINGGVVAEQIGFLHKEDAATIGPAMDAGRIFGAKISSLHGAANPMSHNETAGVNIIITEYKA